MITTPNVSGEPGQAPASITDDPNAESGRPGSDHRPRLLTAGLEIVRQRLERLRMEFFDIGAVQSCTSSAR
jgi:hypothetical protein